MVKKIAFILLAWSFCLGMAAAAKQKFTLVIDAGHGGKDAGACANGAMEKNINLSVALAFGGYVERNCPDVKVIYTRKTDVFIPLHERARIANKNKADLFVSVHTNALPGKRPKQITGLETYTMGMRRSNEKRSAALRENEVILIEDNYKQHYAGYDPRSPESMIVFDFLHEDNMVKSVEMAELIQRNVCRTASRPNGGVKQDVFLVLRETSMPACLVELGYVTTKAEASYLTNKRNVDLLGRGLYQALVAYRNKNAKGGSPNIKVEEPVNKPVKPITQPTKPATQPTTPITQPTKPIQPIVPTVQPANKPVVKPEIKPEPKPDTVVTKPAVPVEEQQATVVEMPVVAMEQTVPVQETPVQTVPVQTVPAQTTPVQTVPVQTTPAQPETAPAPQQARPVFKLQILTSGTKLKAGDARVKGRKDAECYKEGGLWKYTVGASEDYNAVQRLRKELAKTFPQAFVVAFLNGQRVNTNEALELYRKQK